MNDFQFDLYCQQSALRTDKLLVAYETVTKNADEDRDTETQRIHWKNREPSKAI